MNGPVQKALTTEIRPTSSTDVKNQRKINFRIRARNPGSGGRAVQIGVHIADIANTLDPLQTVGRGPQLAAQSTHQVVDSAVEDGILAIQHTFREILPPDRCAG